VNKAQQARTLWRRTLPRLREDMRRFQMFRADGTSKLVRAIDTVDALKEVDFEVAAIVDHGM
jgi:hypothetical protein